MAGMLPKEPKDFIKIPNAKVAIIASSWHRSIVDQMVESAKNELLAIGVVNQNIQVHWAPGSLELPLYAKFLLEKNLDLDGIIAFGVVLRGGTTHNDSVIQSVVNGFCDLTLDYSKPVINEVIGVTKIEDAEIRAVDKGIEAVFAFSETVNFIRSFSGKSKVTGFNN
jgi:6,7-dimethyl-8-ribityllumazine synthase